MKKFSLNFLFISLIFFVSFSSISFVGYSLNNQVNNNENTEEAINIGEQLKNVFVFNHKKQIEEIKQNKESIKNKINNNLTNLSFSQINKKLNNNKDLILWNYYASYKLNDSKNSYSSLTSYMFVYVKQSINKEEIQNWYLDVSYTLSSKENINNKINVNLNINSENLFYKNINFKKIKNASDNFYVSNYIEKHFFIIQYTLEDLNNSISEHYYLDFSQQLEFHIKIQNINGIIRNFNFAFINKSINSFNLNYDENFYSNDLKIILNDFLFLNNNIVKLNLNILLPEKIKIDDLLNNLTIFADYKSYDNSNNGNNYELNFKIDDNYYKYSNSNWYNITIYINNFSKEEGTIYYNFSFFYNNQEIFLNKWINNFKIVTPLFPPEIKSVSYSKNSYFENSFFIDIQFNKEINYQMANNLVFYYKNNGKEEYKYLTNPIYLEYQNTYRYEINFKEDEINDEKERTSLTNFIFINSGYFEYDYLTNSFVKNYKDNQNYLNSTNYEYFFKEIDFIFNAKNKLIIDVADAKIIKKENKYYLDVFYHSNQNWNKDNLKIVNKIEFNYFLYNPKNNSFNENFENLYIKKINNLNYLNNNLEVIYEIQTFSDNSIYANINFSFKNNIYFLPKNIYSTNFSYNSIKNIKIKKINNDSIIFNITYNEILEIQANNLKVTYKDENNNSYNSLKEENLKSNGVVSVNNNEITYEYTLTNLKNNTEYKDFHIYLLNELNSDYKYDWSYSYFLKASFSSNQTIKTKNKMLIIILSLLILFLYFILFSYFLIKYLKYKRSIL